MRELKERAAYLRGLMEGSDFIQDDKQKTLWEGLLNFCDEVAEDVNELRDSQEEFADYIEAIDEDLGSLEKFLYNDENSDDDVDMTISKNDGKDYIECTCPHCKEEIYFEDDDDDTEYEVVCPECGKVVWNHFVAEAKTFHNHDII